MSTNGHAFRVSPLPADLPPRIRREMRDDAGHELTVRLDGERHQCRACLRLTEADEGVILLSHSPFESDTTPFAERGPLFIHERECTPYTEAGVYPAEFPRKAVVLRAYNERNEIEDAVFVGDRPVEDVIGKVLENPRVAFVHARNSALGCYMFRIDRA